MRHTTQISELDNARKMSVLVINTAILVISLISVIVVFVVNRRRLLHKQREEDAARELERFKTSVKEKNLQLEKFAVELDKFRSVQHEETVNESLAQMQQSTILSEDAWNEFRLIFEKVHKGYIFRLKEKFQDLTDSDICYCFPLKPNFSNKEMAAVMGAGSNAVRNGRFRLR